MPSKISSVAGAPSAVVFDCDGTLIDSERVHAKALQRALGRWGIVLDVEQIRSQSTGVANDDFLRRIAQERGVALPDDAEMVVEEMASQLIVEEVRPIEGAEEVVGYLAANGIGLAVASNSGRRLVREMLQAVGLAHAFDDHIVTRDDVPAPKPAPDVYLQAARLLQMRREDMIAVEDSSVGVIAAREAGIRVVGFRPPTAIFSAADLTRAGAFVVIGSLRELRERFFS
jgi:HAD superfamily hydrolase (TIGR01509 family)